jgi:DNA-binding MarR family transcriptional regulator
VPNPAPRRSAERSAEEPRWLSSREEAAWRAMALAMHTLPAALELQLQRDSNLSYIEYHTLARLSEEPDHVLRMSELAALTNASQSRLSHLVRRLERRGLIRRQPDPRDGRFVNARLTSRGYAKLVASAPSHVAAVRAFVMDEFSPAELQQLREASERIVARIVASDSVQHPVV